MIQGDRVRQAREINCLTQSDLASRVPPLTQSQLSRLEADLAPDPDPETTALLAATLGVTPAFLQRPPAPDVAVHSPHFRARSRLTRVAKDAAHQWARLVYEEYRTLRESASVLAVRLERLHGEPPSAAAHEVRRILGFPQHEPIPYLLLEMERAGIVILGLPFAANDLDAFSAWSADEPLVALLGEPPGDRQRFSAAHELGHLALHSPDQRGREVELEADQFAAELLTPLDSIARVIPRHPTLSGLAMLKTEWGVSIKSLIQRARELGLVDQDRATSLYKQISARGWNKSEPGYVAPEKPRAFRKLAEISYGSGPNVERLADDAGWSQELAFRVLGQYASAAELPHLPPPPSTNVIEFPFKRSEYRRDRA
jgi:Zn-dependent peptidase ImmA (M78 family)/transcriptional regulator with XRE-family HTH domain